MEYQIYNILTANIKKTRSHFLLFTQCIIILNSCNNDFFFLNATVCFESFVAIDTQYTYVLCICECNARTHTHMYRVRVYVLFLVVARLVTIKYLISHNARTVSRAIIIDGNYVIGIDTKV